MSNESEITAETVKTLESEITNAVENHIGARPSNKVELNIDNTMFVVNGTGNYFIVNGNLNAVDVNGNVNNVEVVGEHNHLSATGKEGTNLIDNYGGFAIVAHTTPISYERLREVAEKVWDSAQQYSQEESFLEIGAILRALIEEARS